MKKLFVGFLLALIVLLPSVVSANTEVQWDLTGEYEIDFVCTLGGCSGGTYPHVMNIDYMNMDTGEFSGTGTDSDTWTVTGNFTGCNNIAFTIDYDHSGYYVNVVGTISDGGSMSGTWSNPTQAGYWETTSGAATFFERYAVITAPEEDEIVFGLVDFGAYLMDDDYDFVDWAVRKGTCAAGVNTVFGNVDSHTDAYGWVYDSVNNKHTFMATADTCEWDAGKYCFIFNPREDSCEADIRLTREFYVADGRVSGGGQIIEEVGDKKDWYKISFGGGIWDVGSEGYIGDWEVNFHNVSVNLLDKTKFHTTAISEINFSPPGSSTTCVAAMNFTAYGEWNGVPGYKIIFRAGDADSPKGTDTVRVELYNPSNVKVYDTHWVNEFTDESSCVGTARTGLDNGNIKIDFCP